MANLYEINEQILSLIDEETGEIADFEVFEALNLERNTKIENIALWIKNLKTDIEAYKAEKQVFEEKQARAERKRESLLRYLSDILAGEKFKTTRVECVFKTTESVSVGDVYKLPEEYVKYEMPKPNKIAIRAAIKEGKEITGAQLVKKVSLYVK